MHSTGIVRKLDRLGRLTLPKELRKTFDINLKDPLEIFTEDNMIILRKYDPTDIFTNETSDDMIEYKGKKVSRESIKELVKIAGFTIE